MLLTMLFDDEDEDYVSALFQVGDKVLKTPEGLCSPPLLLPVSASPAPLLLSSPYYGSCPAGASPETEAT